MIHIHVCYIRLLHKVILDVFLCFETDSTTMTMAKVASSQEVPRIRLNPKRPQGGGYMASLKINVGKCNVAKYMNYASWSKSDSVSRGVGVKKRPYLCCMPETKPTKDSFTKQSSAMRR